MICPRCSDTIPKGKFRCSCGYNVVPVSLGNSVGIRLSDVKPNKKRRLKTGPWDSMWGTNYDDRESGIAVTSVTLIGGSPGAGKSTLLLMMASQAAKETGKETAYVGIEEPHEQILERANRLGIDNPERIIMLTLEEGFSVDPKRFGLFILDSINAAVGEDLREAVELAKALKAVTKKGMCPSIAISQINKKGELAGLEALQHEVDCTMTFFPTQENLGEEAPRQLVVEKNRNGQAYKKMTFEMTEKGLVVAEEENE